MFNLQVMDAALVKTIDKFILPFILIVASRYIGIFISVFITSLNFELSLQTDLLSAPLIRFSNQSDLVTANSISWVFTALILGIVFSFLAFRSLHLNEDWLHPKETAFFHKKNLSHFLVSGEQTYHQIVAWSLVTLLVLNLSIMDFWLGDLSTLAFGFIISISSLLTVLFTLSLVRDKLK